MKNRFRSLDCLRFLAAVGVILFHVNGKPGNWMSDLYLCVDLFFILSGFVLEPAFPKKRNRKDFLSFIIRRYIRLAPMLYSTLIFSILYNLAIQVKNSISGGANRPSLDLTLATFILSLLFLQIFSSQAILLNYPMWSLSSEWIINVFLIFPLSGNSKNRNSVYVCCVGVFIQISNIFFDYPEFLVQLSRCLAGIIFGVILRKFFENKALPYNHKLILLLIIVFVFGFFLASHSSEKVAPLISMIPFSALIFALANYECSKSMKIPEGVAYWASTLSFGIYVWHVPLAGIVERYSPKELQSNVALRLLALTSFSCLMGLVVSKYFERPIQSYLQKIVRVKLG